MDSSSAISSVSTTGRPQRVKPKKKDMSLPAKRTRRNVSKKERKPDSDDDEDQENEEEEPSIWDKDELTPSPPRTRRSSKAARPRSNTTQKQSSIVRKKMNQPAVVPIKAPAPGPESSDSDKEEEDPETKDLPWYHLIGTHECPLCQKKMARHVEIDVLHKHLQRVHMSQPEHAEGTFYICTACPKLRFRQADTAKQHRASNTCGGRMLWWHNTEKFGGAGRTTYFLTQNKNVHPIHKKLLEEERKR